MKLQVNAANELHPTEVKKAYFNSILSIFLYKIVPSKVTKNILFGTAVHYHLGIIHVKF